MKKIISIALIAALFVCVYSCKKNNVSVDKDPLQAPENAEFLFKPLVQSYYIKSNNQAFAIPVGITNVSSTDRTINFTYSTNTGAVSGTQYTAPASLTIKAGTALDSLRISGIFAGYSGSRKDTLKIKISGGVTPFTGKDSIKLFMTQYCDVIGANIIGDYTKSTDLYNGNASSKPNYTANISNFTLTSATTATIVIKNLGATSDNGWGPFGPTDPSVNPGLTATLDWTSPANFKVAIPLQNYFNDGSGMSTIVATVGTFSSCDQTFSITCQVKYAGNGSTYTHTSIFKR